MAKVISVVDGNTLEVSLRGAPTKIRLYGVIVPPADEARPILARLNKESVAFLHKYLADGWVYLEFPNGDPKPDADGIVPAFIYKGADATFVNDKLVAEGLAIVNNKEKNAFTQKFASSQQNASGTSRGIWGSFAGGDGEKIATGVPQATYIGVAGNQGHNQPAYVTTWLIIYY